MPKRIPRKQSRRVRTANPSGNPGRLLQDNTAQGSSVYIPPRNYLALHVAGIEPAHRETLSWSYQTTAGLAVAFTDQQQVLLNSPYDPDVALGGTSANGFAKWMAFYSKCTVLGARAKVKFALTGSTIEGIPTEASAIGVTITTNSTALTSIPAAVSAGLCDYRIMNVNPDSGVLNLGVDISKFVDKPDILDDSQYFCTATANPNQVVVLHLWTKALSALTTTGVAFVIEVEYDCVFTDPIPFT